MLSAWTQGNGRRQLAEREGSGGTRGPRKKGNKAEPRRSAKKTFHRKKSRNAARYRLELDRDQNMPRVEVENSTAGKGR